MKLVALPLVNQIAWSRDVLIEKLRDIDASKFAVTIGGRESEDCELKRQIKPHLQHALRERLRQLNRDLGEYGVDVIG